MPTTTSTSPERKRGRQDGPPEPDPDWTIGDFTLVSSDNVLFKVDSRVLLGASAALCGMVGMIDDGEKTLTFVDAVLERARIIRKFLRVITTGRLHIEPTLSYTLDLLKFCQKYECTAAFEAVLNILQNAVLMDQPLKLPEVFVIGATVDSVELCTAVLKRGCQALQALSDTQGQRTPTHFGGRQPPSWGPRRTKPQRIGSERKPPANEVVSVHDLPDEAWLECRSEYLWALYRASGDMPQPDMWKTFRNLVHAAKRAIAGAPREPPKPRNHREWASVASGDLELISADNVHFRVASYHILAASPILREKITRKGPEKMATIRFDDRLLETEKVIEMFLTLITTGRFVRQYAKGECSPPIPPELRLATFLKRYECVVPMRTLANELDVAATVTQMSDPMLMLVAAILGMYPLAIRAMRNDTGKDGKWRPVEDHDEIINGECRSGWYIFDPISWPYTYWMVVPPLWLLAFCYAHDHGSDWAVRSAFLEDKLRQLYRLGTTPTSVPTPDSPSEWEVAPRSAPPPVIYYDYSSSD